MDDSAEGEVILQFLWAHVELVTHLSRLCPLPLESLVCLCALLDRTTLIQACILLVVIGACLILIRHPECHSRIREGFALLPRAFRILRQKCRIFSNDDSTLSQAGTSSPESPQYLRWKASDGMCEAYAIKGKRAYMEDRFHAVSDPQRNLYLYGIFDGHGGNAAAEYTRKRLFPAILARVVQSSQNVNIPAIQEILREEILRLDEAFVSEAKKSSDYSGSTCLVAVVFRDTLIVANVGDSRGVMATETGRIVPISFDHKPQQMKELKRIKAAGGFISFNGVWRVAGILSTSRAIGDFPLKVRKLVTADPDIHTFNLVQQQTSFIVLASDGLWDVLTNEDAVSILREQKTLAGGAKELVKQAYQKGSLDNISVIVIDLSTYAPLRQALSPEGKTRETRPAAASSQANEATADDAGDLAPEPDSDVCTKL